MDCLDAYAKTGNSVYYFGKKQSQIKDPQSFEIVNNIYAKDSKSVYKLCNLEPLGNDDASTFKTVGTVCSKSSSSVYCYSKPVLNADPATFENVWGGYYRDKYHVYYFGKVLEGINPSTFELLSWGYMKDGSELYFFDENKQLLSKLVNPDKDSFEVLTNYYAKDKFNFYKRGVIVGGVDPTTSVVPKN